MSRTGYAQFTSVTLAHVTLQQGRIVSITYNDYREASQEICAHTNMPKMTKGLTLNWRRCHQAMRGALGCSFVIEDSEMSDCVTVQYGVKEALPGCPEEALPCRRECLVAMDPAEVDAMFAGPQATVKRGPLLSAVEPWALQLRLRLGPLPLPPPDWPPCAVSLPVNRTVHDPVHRGQLVPVGSGPTARVHPPPPISLPPQRGTACGDTGLVSGAGILPALAAVARRGGCRVRCTGAAASAAAAAAGDG